MYRFFKVFFQILIHKSSKYDQKYHSISIIYQVICSKVYSRAKLKPLLTSYSLHYTIKLNYDFIHDWTINIYPVHRFFCFAIICCKYTDLFLNKNTWYWYYYQDKNNLEILMPGSKSFGSVSTCSLYKVLIITF